MVEVVVSPLLDRSDRRFRSRHYGVMWPHRCVRCHRQIVTLEEVWRRIRSGDEIVLLCDQCDLVDPEFPATPAAEVDLSAALALPNPPGTSRGREFGFSLGKPGFRHGRGELLLPSCQG